MARDVIFVGTMTEMTPAQLSQVIGGADDSFGRCGPGNGWRFLGNVRTPQCAAHDQAVRDALKGGASYLGAQLQALPKLPAAVASYVKTKLG